MTARRLDLGDVMLWTGDAATVVAMLPTESVDCVVTTRLYWRLRDYGVPGQYGHEDTLEGFIDHLRAVFVQLRRVLKPAGTVWLNLGDSYSSRASGPPGRTCRIGRTALQQAKAARQTAIPHKNLLGVPWRVALALQDDGWILRSEIIWHKPNAIPESVKDRPARRHEHLFLLTRSPRYFFNLDPIREPYAGDRPLKRRKHRTANKPHTITSTWPPPPGKYEATEPFTQPPGSNLQPCQPHAAAHPAGRNPGTVWSLPTRPSRHHHYAAFPIDIPLRCIAAGCPPRGLVLDPFSGSGTTLLAAQRLRHPAIGIDLNPSFHQIAQQRLAEDTATRARSSGASR
jgi:site-specific DNA-methyltransferase (cytosine-N4-specific)